MPPLAVMPTVMTPVTVAFGVGVVKFAVTPPPFCTVIERVAVAEPPAASVTVRPSVYVPLATVVEFQVVDAAVLLVDADVKICVPFTVSR